MSGNWDEPSGWTADTQPLAEYEYLLKNKAGNWIYDYTVERGRRPDGEKAIRQWRTVGYDDLIIARANGEKVDDQNCRILNIGTGRKRHWLYRSKEIEGIDKSEIVWLCEGERDTESLRELGFVGTTSPGGAGKFKDCFALQLQGRQVVCVPDNDDSGRKHMADAYCMAKPLAADFRIIELWQIWPAMPEGGDVTDWLEQGGGTKEKLIALAQETSVPEWVNELGKPVIHVIGGKLDEQATAAEEALLRAHAPFYAYGQEICRPVIDEVEAAKGRTTKVARLATATPDMLRDYLCRVARWVKFDQRKRELFAIDPPHDVAKIMLSRDGEWKFPKIVGVITTPTIRPDGSLLTDAGYDESTRLVLLEPPALPRMSLEPTKQEAEAALELLEELLQEFPFVNEASKSVALSALITPVCMGAMPVAPMHIANAPMPGTGKSYLFDIVSAIALGRICPVISAGGSVEETEKRLGAALMKGQTLISIDNLNGELAGEALCQLIERPVVELRVLGQSKMTTIETRRFITANGNNIRVVDDVARRTVFVMLDAEIERPETRQFTKRPFDMVLADRGKYIAAVLTIVRAYIVAEYPDPAPVLASFEDWSRLVRSSLIWLGKADPVATMEAARADDPQLEALLAVVVAWKSVIGDQSVLTKELKAYAERTEKVAGSYGDEHEFKRVNPELFDALMTATEGFREIDNAKLGRWLGRQKGKIVQGVKLASELDGKTKQPKWSLKSLKKDNLAGVAGVGGGFSKPVAGNSFSPEMLLRGTVFEMSPQTPATPADDHDLQEM